MALVATMNALSAFIVGFSWLVPTTATRAFAVATKDSLRIDFPLDFEEATRQSKGAIQSQQG